MGSTLIVVDASGAPHIPTAESRELVSKAAACGTSVAAIAYLLGIPPLDVKRYYADELEFGPEIWTAVIGSKLIDTARHGDVNAQRFFLQARARWSIPNKVEMEAHITDEQSQERARIMESIIGMVKPKEPVPPK